MAANASTHIGDLLASGADSAGSLIRSTTDQANQRLTDSQNQSLGLFAPYTSTGTNALGQLNSMVNGGGFQAPTGLTEGNDPGYQARMALGQQAVERSAAARGGALGGAAGKELTQYGQTFGSNEYGNVYNRALGTYQTNFGNLQQLANLGLYGAGQDANTINSTAARTSGNMMSSGTQQADYITQAANARASGYAGMTNANLNQLSQLGRIGGELAPTIGSGMQGLINAFRPKKISPDIGNGGSPLPAGATGIDSQGNPVY